MHTIFLVFGVVVHLVLLYSIFDVYYSSPIIKNARPHPITKNGIPPAKRLVIFSADRVLSLNGQINRLICTRLFENGKGSWGISKSHVPTESRPGHVAMMAGFYEDVSAVARGWKHNPVPFDSTLNESNKAWLWGSPDIVNLFVETLKPGILQVGDSYSADEEDFASSDASKLDEWVFDKVTTYLSTEGNNKYIINTDRAIFFLHLLGLDTNGHGNKPHSRNYVDNIETVDNGIKRMVALFEKTFNFDNRTAYLFTSDHGMTDWGSHGAGTDDEILVPFVTWGAGIRKTAIKHVINQVDLAPLQSALLGMAVPVNSMGILPVLLLEASPKYKFQAAYGNFKQMTEQYSISRSERWIHSLPFMFREYPGFQASALSKVEKEIFRLTTNGAARWDAAITVCLQWIPRVRDALLYFHRYQRFSLGLSIVALYISWNVVIYTIVTSNALREMQNMSAIFLPNHMFKFILGSSAFLSWIQALPWTYYIYYLMPIFTTSIAYNLNIPKQKLNRHQQSKKSSFTESFFGNIIEIIGVEPGERHFNFAKWKEKLAKYLVILGIAMFLLTTFVTVFFERSVLSVIFLCISPIWLLDCYSPGRRFWSMTWLFCCLILAIFPMLDTVGSSPYPVLVIISPLTMAFLLYTYCSFASTYRTDNALFSFKLLIYIYLIAVFCNSYSIFYVQFFGIHQVPLFIRIFSWCTIPLGLILPISTSNFYTSDILVLWLASVYLPYSMLSISYESLFLLVFSIFLIVFMRLETENPDSNRSSSNEDFFTKTFNSAATKNSGTLNGLSNDRNQSEMCMESRPFQIHEWRRSILLVAMVEMAFFGTGNIASLNSFNTNFLLNFVTVFSPFSMAALLLLKISIPFFQLALVFAAILHTNHTMLPRLAAITMHITDAMAVVFFYNLRDEGSWLDIGLSISNYVISALTSIIILILLHFAGHLLLVRVNFSDFVLATIKRPLKTK